MNYNGGYSDLQLNQITYTVTAQGNSYTSADRVNAILLRRCAELTLNNGYKYFLITSKNSQILKSYYIASQGSSTTNATEQTDIFGVKHYSQNTTYQLPDVQETDQAVAKATIQMTNTFNDNVLDASIIMNQTGYLVSNNAPTS
ncbi:MAG: hypothetical protein K0S29_1030, partial [Gammaproteobacteria bacterium]|nr:hypothetical protein [Gammaproteobacteria bacterium]